MTFSAKTVLMAIFQLLLPSSYFNLTQQIVIATRCKGQNIQCHYLHTNTEETQESPVHVQICCICFSYTFT